MSINKPTLHPNGLTSERYGKKEPLALSHPERSEGSQEVLRELYSYALGMDSSPAGRMLHCVQHDSYWDTMILRIMSKVNWACSTAFSMTATGHNPYNHS